jgi:hypothetical protein
MTLPKDSFQAHKCDPPSLEITVSKEELLRMYNAMVTMRRMETTADTLYKSQLIRGFCHLCTGQVNHNLFIYFAGGRAVIISFSYVQKDRVRIYIVTMIHNSFFFFFGFVSVLIPGIFVAFVGQTITARVVDDEMMIVVLIPIWYLS